MSSTVNAVQAAVYGLVQGLTEFLPVSSTGHLRLAQQWLNPGTNQAGFTAFTAVIQLCTTLAVVLYFWRELVHITDAWMRGLLHRSVRDSQEYRMAWCLILATIPIAARGLVSRHQSDTSARNPWAR